MSLAITRGPTRWTLTLDRPDKANALSADLVEALIGAVGEAESQPIAVLVLRGNGRNFSAGFDFTGYEDQSEADLVLRFVRIETLLQALARLPCLTVGLAHGRNFGAGVDLLAACKWRVAAPQSTYRMPGLAFGLVLGTRRFAALVGREKARETLGSLATFDAQAAREMGFVRAVAPVEDWPDVLAQAEAAAAKLPPAHRATLYQALEGDSHDTDLAALVRSASAPGLKDRIRAYLAAR